MNIQLFELALNFAKETRFSPTPYQLIEKMGEIILSAKHTVKKNSLNEKSEFLLNSGWIVTVEKKRGKYTVSARASFPQGSYTEKIENIFG